MSAALRQRILVDSATQDLWRVAETNEVEELEHVLPRVTNIDARNRHGMTALMRAAYHGHEQMVRALLERGADPNVMRNDRFTALALAAFFGHTETVRILIEHGAETEVLTRCGASAYTWATARTFDEAARCLQSGAPAPTPIRAPAPVAMRPAAASVTVPVTPAPIFAPAPVTPAPAPVTPAPAPVSSAPATLPVKTLSEPPEIWDLVHEVPRSFNASSAFLARVRSMHRGVAVCVLAGILLIVACGVGALLLRRPYVANVPAEIHTTQPAPSSEAALPKPVVDTTANAPVNSSELKVSETPGNPVGNSRRRVPFKPRTSDTPLVVQEPSKQAEQTVATPQFEKPKTADTATRPKANEALNPQVITPAQNTKPKAKVIQWP